MGGGGREKRRLGGLRRIPGIPAGMGVEPLRGWRGGPIAYSHFPWFLDRSLSLLTGWGFSNTHLPFIAWASHSHEPSLKVLPDTSSVLQTRVPVWRGCDRGVGLRGK